MDTRIKEKYLGTFLHKKRIKNKMIVETNINTPSMVTSTLETGRGNKTAANPGIRRVLNTLDPMIPPKVISDSFLTNETKPTANSGKLVPTESKNKPWNLESIFKRSPST